MSKDSLQAACLGVGLVSAWAPIASAGFTTEVRFQSNLSRDLDHAMVMLSGSGSGQPFAMLSGLSIPGSGSGAFGSPVSASGIGSGFAMIGLGSGSGGIDLVVSIGGLTVINGASFESTFPGWVENDLISSLRNGTPLAQDFLLGHFNSIFRNDGASSHVMAFSAATDIGAVTFSVVDVPGPAGLSAMPLLLMVWRRRR